MTAIGRLPFSIFPLQFEKIQVVAVLELHRARLVPLENHIACVHVRLTGEDRAIAVHVSEVKRHGIPLPAIRAVKAAKDAVDVPGFAGEYASINFKCSPGSS